MVPVRVVDTWLSGPWGYPHLSVGIPMLVVRLPSEAVLQLGSATAWLGLAVDCSCPVGHGQLLTYFLWLGMERCSVAIYLPTVATAHRRPGGGGGGRAFICTFCQLGWLFLGVGY